MNEIAEVEITQDDACEHCVAGIYSLVPRERWKAAKAVCEEIIDVAEIRAAPPGWIIENNARRAMGLPERPAEAQGGENGR